MILKKLNTAIVMVILSAAYNSCIERNDNANVQDSKETVVKFYTDLYSSNNQSKADLYVGSSYKEHQPESGDYTYMGLKNYALQTAKNTNYKITVHRIIQQGAYVFLHVEEKNSEKTIAHGELFKLGENGKIIEHWGNLQEQPATTANGRTMFDGAKVNYTLTSGISNLAKFKQADADMFNKLDYSIVEATRVATTAATVYKQHNPFIKDGREQLGIWFQQMKDSGTTLSVSNKFILGEGDFIVEMNYFNTNNGAGEDFIFDIIRIRPEDALTDEHWDIVQSIKGKDITKVY
ncbi:hypothetical protein [Chryseobacterium viscerum]|uniref:hypothetical protein n=1 Tax=Chryseobacterium viscerum TaxID=1037377 RepID=UPI00222140C5|nr:hypothetical protein [Chryseobacterium viscerum]MCW1961270.1 hypothetical protein [Chryseobacterium viscerum]